MEFKILQKKYDRQEQRFEERLLETEKKIRDDIKNVPTR